MYPIVLGSKVTEEMRSKEQSIHNCLPNRHLLQTAVLKTLGPPPRQSHWDFLKAGFPPNSPLSFELQAYP